MCDVPDQLKTLSNAICQMYLSIDCERLPCYLIYSSSKTLQNIQCLNDNNNISCSIGYSLDLFLNKNSYPSIIIDPLTKFSNHLYINELNNKYRDCDSLWGIKFNFESIANYPWNSDEYYLKLFDIKFGYDRSIYDFIPKPWLFNYIQQIQNLSIQQIIEMKKPIYPNKNYWINNEKSCSQINCSSYVKSPILWMNTNCQTLSKRTEYITQLMKFISIDNYGNCGENILNLPENIIKIQNSENKSLTDRSTYLWEKGKLTLANDYLFLIAYENTFNYDYITEKIWHAFITGAIPIYYGAPNIEHWLPCDHQCIIDLRLFKTPEQAATYIQHVANNKTLYLSYHQWRNQPISDKFNKMINYFNRTNHLNLECTLCYLSNQVKQNIHKHVAITNFKKLYQIF